MKIPFEKISMFWPNIIFYIGKERVLTCFQQTYLYLLVKHQ